jgi:hypothetical protein
VVGGWVGGSLRPRQRAAGSLGLGVRLETARRHRPTAPREPSPRLPRLLPLTSPLHTRAALPFIALNPPPFRLPGGELFRVPLDFKPNPAKVARAKRQTAWKVGQGRGRD